MSDEERYKSEPADDALISDRAADVVDRVTAITRIGVDRILRLEGDIARQLDDPSEMVRGEAIKVLVGAWKLGRYLDEAVRMLRDEEDDMTRSAAAWAIGWFARRREGHPPLPDAQRQLVIGELVRALLEDPDEHVQEQSYEILHWALTGSFPSLPGNFKRETDVDWSVLRPYVPASRIPDQPPQPPPRSTDADKDLLWNDEADPREQAAAIERLAADRRYDAAWPVMRKVDDESGVLRGRALLELVRTWRYDEYFQQVREMLLEDPDPEARALAAEAVPYLYVWKRRPGWLDECRNLLGQAIVRESDEEAERAIRAAIAHLDAFTG